MKITFPRAAVAYLALAALLPACATRPAPQSPGGQPATAQKQAPPVARPAIPPPAPPAAASAARPASKREVHSDLPNEPFLRIETGMHSTGIKRIGIDADNRWLVSGATDKTVRVWDLAGGDQSRVIRLPIMSGNDGMLYTVALSPDGRLVACAGFLRSGGSTPWETGQGFAIYLFDRAGGQLIHRIDGLPEVVDHLVFSLDGSRLAALLHAGHGLRVFNLRDFAPAAQDADYGSDCYGADMDRAGRLVTTCYDGLVRLYDERFRLIAKRKAPEGDKPYGAAFSPDGSRIALGYGRSNRISVLSGLDLSPLYSPDSTGIDNGAMYSVTFSADGRFLYSGGSWGPPGKCLIRRWSDAGRGGFIDTLASANTVLHMLPLKAGGIVYGSSDPAWGILDASGARRRFTGPAQAELRGNYDGFLVNRDAGTVRFSFEYDGRAPAQFSIAARRLVAGALQADRGLSGPRLAAAGLEVTNWKHNYAPKLNGQALKLSQNEISRSLAIAPDGQSFLLGAEWSLRMFNRDGSQRWSHPLQSVGWLVNIAPDGRSAVAALGDGTIRWYDLRDGRELLALYAHADRKRWVLWTPGGYYDCSPGGEDLIGWHVNNGRDSGSDFFPAARFRSTFYRPDVIARMLIARDEREALRQANTAAGRRDQAAELLKKLPPTVAILAPTDGETIGADEVVLRFRLGWPADSPVNALRVLLDGRPVGGAVDVSGDSSRIRELRLPNPGKDCEIALIVENRNGASEAARVKVKVARAVQPAAPKPRLNFLSIGVGAYRDEKLGLRFPAKDARDLAAAMSRQAGGLYREVSIKLLTDQEATRDEILKGLDWLRQSGEFGEAGDVSMVFFSGRGLGAVEGFYFFLPFEGDPDDLLRTGVFFADLREALSSVRGKAVLLLDSCRSADPARTGDDITGVVNELSSAENGVVVFAASSGGQSSSEDERMGNGAFARALLDGLAGAAGARGDGRITVNGLDAFLTGRIGELTGGRQTPAAVRPHTVPDFALAGKPGR